MSWALGKSFMDRRLIVHNGKNAVFISSRTGECLSRAIWLSGQIDPAPLCTGLGRCGRCRVRFADAAPAATPEDVQILGQKDVAAGWRLACRHVVPVAKDDIHLELPESDPASMAPQTVWADSTARGDSVLAVDLGTTSIYWRVLDGDRSVAGEGHCLNPQAGAGSDVVSRLAMAHSAVGREHLARMVVALLERICAEAAVHGRPVSRICLAGNTAMTGIVLERDISGLCVAPYRISDAGDEWVQLGALPPVYIPPLPAPFVGGDISAGLACLVAEETPRPFVLADMGTNGELALVTEDDGLFLTSVPLGPALEGIGPACGQQAGPGVITSFALGPLGLTASVLQDGGNGGPCRGISATGYLSLLGHLVGLGVLDATGHFVNSEALAMPLARKIAQGLHSRNAQSCLALPYGQWLEAGDVELLLKVRACFALALRQILQAANIPASSLQRLCLAGSLGEHVDISSLETVGFVPQGMGPRIVAAGNTSLRGAALLVRDKAQADALARWCAKAHVLPLAELEGFQQQYLQAMRLEAWS